MTIDDFPLGGAGCQIVSFGKMKIMTPDEMKRRTKAFGLRAIRLVHSLPRGAVGEVIGRQLLRAATGVGANYRAACRARSTADFIAKLKLVEEEADESAYWLEPVIEGAGLSPRLIRPLLREAEEIVAIVVASIQTTRGRRTTANASPAAPATQPALGKSKHLPRSGEW